MDGVNPLSRTAAADDDGLDQIGVDSPRSGVATPKPDLHDRRLPGIMSYFNQVRASSLQRLWSGSFGFNGRTTTTPKPAMSGPEEELQAATPTELPPTPAESDLWTGSPAEGPPLLAHEMLGPTDEAAPGGAVQEHSYPSPPASQPSSLRNFPGVSCSQKLAAEATPPVSRPPSLRQLSIADPGKGAAKVSSLLAPLTTMVTESSVSARHLSNPARRPSTVPSSPSRERDFLYESASLVHLKQKLTSKKSGTSTPNRAPSSEPSQGEEQEESRQRSGNGVDRTATSTPTPPGAQAPAAKGKLTIKVTEARGLRKCQNPYVVVVFQRSELISSGPRATEDDDEAAISAVATGGMPMKRQGSDSGRPMAIPMRSRQSSNTSVSDFSTFRNRNARRSFTNPKWDAEAIL